MNRQKRSRVSANTKSSQTRYCDGDVAVIIEKIGIPIGATVEMVRRHYGGAFSLHLEEVRPTEQAARTERDRWIVTCWGGDAMVYQGATPEPLFEVDREETLAKAETLVGARVQAVSIDSSSVRLKLAFTTGLVIAIAPDASFEGSSWMVTVPNGRTLSVTVSASLSWEE
jgi:hypothetical protein